MSAIWRFDVNRRYVFVEVESLACVAGGFVSGRAASRHS